MPEFPGVRTLVRSSVMIENRFKIVVAFPARSGLNSAELKMPKRLIPQHNLIRQLDPKNFSNLTNEHKYLAPKHTRLEPIHTHSRMSELHRIRVSLPLHACAAATSPFFPPGMNAPSIPMSKSPPSFCTSASGSRRSENLNTRCHVPESSVT